MAVGQTDIQVSTDLRFVGFMNIWADDPTALSALLSQFGNPDNAAITDTDYAQCTPVDYGSGNVRKYLSFTAVIQFQP